jgi:uncharacterized membrane protein (GlpM family)
MAIILWILGLGFVIAVIDHFTGRHLTRMRLTEVWSVSTVIALVYVLGSNYGLSTIVKYIAYFLGACLVLGIGVAVYILRKGDLGGSVDEDLLKRWQESKFKD